MQPSVDNQYVPTDEKGHWCDAFVILKSDFTELEKYVKALIQLSHKIGVTNDFITKLLKATRKVL